MRQVYYFNLKYYLKVWVRLFCGLNTLLNKIIMFYACRGCTNVIMRVIRVFLHYGEGGAEGQLAQIRDTSCADDTRIHRFPLHRTHQNFLEPGQRRMGLLGGLLTQYKVFSCFYYNSRNTLRKRLLYWRLLKGLRGS